MERKCYICGRAIGCDGRKKVCSEACRKELRRQYNTAYVARYYRTHEDYRQRRLRQSLESHKRTLAQRKEKAMRELIEELTLADPSEYRGILAKYTTLKGETYARK